MRLERTEDLIEFSEAEQAEQCELQADYDNGVKDNCTGCDVFDLCNTDWQSPWCHKNFEPGF